MRTIVPPEAALLTLATVLFAGIILPSTARTAERVGACVEIVSGDVHVPCDSGRAVTNTEIDRRLLRRSRLTIRFGQGRYGFVFSGPKIGSGPSFAVEAIMVLRQGADDLTESVMGVCEPRDGKSASDELSCFAFGQHGKLYRATVTFGDH